MITKPPTTINFDPAANIFLVEFLTPDARMLAVSPLYVVGVEETANGVSIRVARGGVSDQFMVRGPVREVVDRLRACWDRAQDSFLSSFLRSDCGSAAMEDRLMQRIQERLTDQNLKLRDTLNMDIPKVVRSEIEKMAASDAPPPTGHSKVPKKP